MKPTLMIPRKALDSAACLSCHAGGRPVGVVMSGPAGAQAFALGLSLGGADRAFIKAVKAAGIPVALAPVDRPGWGLGLGEDAAFELSDGFTDEATADLAGIFDFFKSAAGKAKTLISRVTRGTHVTASAGPIKVDLTDPASRARALAAIRSAASGIEVSAVRPADQPIEAPGMLAKFNALPAFTKLGIIAGAAVLAMDAFKLRRGRAR